MLTQTRVPSCQGAGTSRWITTKFAITDGFFGRRCHSKVGAADIVLAATAGSDMIVHGLEIYDPSKLL